MNEQTTEYTYLEIYKTTYSLTRNFAGLNINKKYKYTIGEYLINQSVEILVIISHISKNKLKQARVEMINKAIDLLEIISIKTRLLKDFMRYH